MNKIKILSPDQAQKIAAGEVIERPSNVIKELVENSIDASATQVTICIKNYGKDLIQVIDNGSGMSFEDANLCFHSHATSKITDVNEIENVNSFGFRGEALASISAISRVTLITKSNQLLPNAAGTKIEFRDGKIQTSQSVACNVGTDIRICDLFYNVPVRKKFLKQDETEWNQIQTIFNAFCLSHLNIHFKLFRDDKIILNAPSVTDVKVRVSQVFDSNVSQCLLELNSSHEIQADWLNIKGYISNHNFWRYGRTHIFSFINNRWVKNSELTKAIIKGYLNVLPQDKYPAAFIFLDVDKKFVDINCHPKKEEIRFLKPLVIQCSLQKIIKSTLEKNISSQLCPKYPFQGQVENKERFIPSRVSNFSMGFDEQLFYTQPNKNDFLLKQFNFENNVNNKTDTELYSFKIIGQLFKTYIIIENDENLVIIDQHAAHERILYERMLKNFTHKDGVKLIFPEIVQLTVAQINLISTQKDFLQKQGIEFEAIGKNSISIKSGPAGLPQASLPELILEIIGFIEENGDGDVEIFRKKLNEHIHSHLACKSAIKAGDNLTLIQIQNLVQDLNKTEQRFICIHGRPTTWTISKLDLEKKFKRK